jgi:molybdenum cofactor cytidylyltransferase
MSERGPIAAVILAAGQSSRYRAADPSAVSKVVAKLDGKPLVRRVAEAALAAGLAPVVVVTGFARAETEAALAGLDVRFTHNAAFASGLASSLKAGVASLPPETAGVAILLADMPKVSSDVLVALAAAFDAKPDSSAVVPTFRGQRGNPVFISRTLFEAVASLEGDVGARQLLRGRDDVVEVPFVDDGVALDVDTPDTLRSIGG